MNSETKILIIEDEKPISRFLQVLMSGHEYQVKTVETAKQGLLLVANWSPHLILLDLGLPDLDGVAVIEEIRAWSNTPIIVISARNKESDKVATLDAGANDYLTKPFGSDELLARIRVALRLAARDQISMPMRFQISDVTIDLSLKKITRNETPIKLTKTEYNILKFLCRNAGKVITHKQILQEVWGNNYTEHAHYVRIHVAQLRRKIELDPAQPMHIITETGIGYRLVDACEV
ncbi:response regulator [Vibrio taketomensis]|uniref:response regulator n=1 Tax=Vibrio taketomensis TaxID=2572923 RepID=UPI00138958D4|nr:response regulator [Vibrio taketomensis]